MWLLPTSDKVNKLDPFKQSHPNGSDGIYSNPGMSHYEDTMELYACPDVPGNYEMVRKLSFENSLQQTFHTGIFVSIVISIVVSH